MNNFKKISQIIFNLIKNNNPIIIHCHINPDGDALGSKWGLKTIIENNFQNKNILVPGLKNENLKSLFPKSNTVTIKDYKNALVIITDTANQERINSNFWKKGKIIIKIDHHPNIDKYGDIHLIDETASSTCQIIAKWAKELNLKISNIAAKNLFLGIITDSGRFLYKSVNKETFQIASFLMKKKFNLLKLYNNLYIEKLNIIRLKGYILSNFKITNNGVAFIIFNYKKINYLEKKFFNKNNLNLKCEDLTNQVNILSNIKGIKIWLIAAYDKLNQKIKVSVRSEKIVINEIIKNFGGGGHQNAVSAYLKNINIVKNLIKNLDNIIKQKNINLK